MKTGHKIVSLGCLAVGVASAVRWRWMIRMPLQEFTRYALYMAVMDDEICRNELEGNQIGDEIITFPPKVETLQERYHLFLQMNRVKAANRSKRKSRKWSSDSRSPGSTVASQKSKWRLRSPGETICDRGVLRTFMPVITCFVPFLTRYGIRCCLSRRAFFMFRFCASDEAEKQGVFSSQAYQFFYRL